MTDQSHDTLTVEQAIEAASFALGKAEAYDEGEAEIETEALAVLIRAATELQTELSNAEQRVKDRLSDLYASTPEAQEGETLAEMVERKAREPVPDRPLPAPQEARKEGDGIDHEAQGRREDELGELFAPPSPTDSETEIERINREAIEKRQRDLARRSGKTVEGLLNEIRTEIIHHRTSGGSEGTAQFYEKIAAALRRLSQDRDTWKDKCGQHEWNADEAMADRDRLQKEGDRLQSYAGELCDEIGRLQKEVERLSALQEKGE